MPKQTTETAIEWQGPEVAATWPEGSVVLSRVPDASGGYFHADNWWRPDWMGHIIPGSVFALIRSGPLGDGEITANG